MLSSELFVETVDCSNVKNKHRCGRRALAVEGYCRRCLREGANPIADAREAKKAERKSEAEARAEVRKRNERLHQARKPGGGIGIPGKTARKREKERMARVIEERTADKKVIEAIVVVKPAPSSEEKRAARRVAKKARGKARS